MNLKDMKLFTLNQNIGKVQKFLTSLAKSYLFLVLQENGNHLMMSLCDGQKQLASLPGEDFLLREFLSRVKEDEAEALKSLRSKNNIDYILKMSGAYFDKWKRLDYYIKRSFKPKLWSGQQPINKSHVTDFQDLLPPIKYKEFKNYLISKIMKLETLRDFLIFF